MSEMIDGYTAQKIKEFWMNNVRWSDEKANGIWKSLLEELGFLQERIKQLEAERDDLKTQLSNEKAYIMSRENHLLNLIADLEERLRIAVECLEFYSSSGEPNEALDALSKIGYTKDVSTDTASGNL